jgi:hypothetical protein
MLRKWHLKPNHIEAVDKATNRNLRPLIRMTKAWQDIALSPPSRFNWS